MAAKIDVSSLTLNAKENPDFMKFVFERVFEQPELTTIHRIWPGITMQEQIVFASVLDKVGIADASCARPNSGATATMTQKYWAPANIGDSLINCQPDVNALFKAYYDKIKRYEEKFDITGSDQEKYLMVIYIDAISKAIKRHAWFGDTSVAIANAGAAGTTGAALNKYYSVIDGIWKEVFAAVGALSTDLQRYTITENAEITTVAQLDLADGRAEEIFEAVWNLADSRLRNDTNAKMMVTRQLWENYRKDLQKRSSENYKIELLTDGLKSIRWNGIDVVNMETIWDKDLYEDFYDNTENNAYYLPNRVLFTVPDNIPIGTLNDNDFTEMDSWYEKLTRQNHMTFGFTLDAKLLENYMAVTAY